MSEDFDLDVDPVDSGCADLDVVPVPEQQDTVQLERGTRLRGQAVDQDLVTWGYAVLLPTADDDSRQRCIRLGHGE